MTDPIAKPISDDDKVYADLGPPDYARIPNTNQLRADVVRRHQQREHNALLAMIASEGGQITLMRVLKFCGIYQTTQEDREAEGRRQVGLFLIAAINDADPEAYPLLLQKHLKRQRDIAASEAAIAEDHRRKAGIGRRIITSARSVIRSTAKAVADSVW